MRSISIGIGMACLSLCFRYMCRSTCVGFFNANFERKRQKKWESYANKRLLSVRSLNAEFHLNVVISNVLHHLLRICEVFLCRCCFSAFGAWRESFDIFFHFVWFFSRFALIPFYPYFSVTNEWATCIASSVFCLIFSFFVESSVVERLESYRIKSRWCVCIFVTSERFKNAITRVEPQGLIQNYSTFVFKYGHILYGTPKRLTFTRNRARFGFQFISITFVIVLIPREIGHFFSE